MRRSRSLGPGPSARSIPPAPLLQRPPRPRGGVTCVVRTRFRGLRPAPTCTPRERTWDRAALVPGAGRTPRRRIRPARGIPHGESVVRLSRPMPALLVVGDPAGSPPPRALASNPSDAPGHPEGAERDPHGPAAPCRSTTSGCPAARFAGNAGEPALPANGGGIARPWHASRARCRRCSSSATLRGRLLLAPWPRTRATHQDTLRELNETLMALQLLAGPRLRAVPPRASRAMQASLHYPRTGVGSRGPGTPLAPDAGVARRRRPCGVASSSRLGLEPERRTRTP